jgi:dTDP-4-dehydrorhamnose 3,5-epimerase
LPPKQSDISEVRVLEPIVFEDARGFFMETYHARRLSEAGIRDQFVQDNHSLSVRGTLRGLHYQLQHPQAKLCRVVRGEVFDVAVDIRRGSPTFGKWFGMVLSESNRLQLYVPAGFAHGFCVLSDRAEFLYKCSDYYAAGDEKGIIWNDPQLAIDWPTAEPLLSAKDAAYPRLAELAPSDLPIYRAASAGSPQK